MEFCFDKNRESGRFVQKIRFPQVETSIVSVSRKTYLSTKMERRCTVHWQIRKCTFHVTKQSSRVILTLNWTLAAGECWFSKIRSYALSICRKQTMITERISQPCSNRKLILFFCGHLNNSMTYGEHVMWSERCGCVLQSGLHYSRGVGNTLCLQSWQHQGYGGKKEFSLTWLATSDRTTPYST